MRTLAESPAQETLNEQELVEIEAQLRDYTCGLWARSTITDLVAEVRRVAQQLEQDELRELARSARNTAAAPDYDEEAIKDALWALVDAVLVPPVEAATDEGATKTRWVEHLDGGGHWASNWELGQEADV
jgi:glutamyl-tRNA reductase